MTQVVAELVKEAGFKSVKEFAALIGVTPRTLNNWKVEQINEFLLFAKLKQEIQKKSEKAKIILAMLS